MWEALIYSIAARHSPVTRVSVSLRPSVQAGTTCRHINRQKTNRNTILHKRAEKCENMAWRRKPIFTGQDTLLYGYSRATA